MKPSEMYRRNATVLASFQPALATILENLSIPDDARRMATRDGRESFVLTDEEGHRRWIGQSSMPSISAEAMLAGFQSDGRSVALPGVMTGLEPFVLAEKLPAHAAVFVVEYESANLRMALDLYDYTPLIESGRVVFLLIEPFHELVREFFTNHPGYELPLHLLSLPQISAATMADLQDRLEAVAPTVVAIQRSEVERCLRSLSARVGGGVFEARHPRVAVLSVDARPEGLAMARRVRRALQPLGWEYAMCVPDSPANQHLVSRLAAIESVSANVVLALGSLSADFKDLLPDSLPWLSWYWPGSMLESSTPRPWKPSEHVWAGSKMVAAVLGDTDEARSRIEICLPAATLAPESRSRSASLTLRGTEVLLLQDVPDDRAESLGIGLPSQVQLWETIVAEVGRRIDTYDAELAEDYVRAAERTAGVELEDESLRSRFVSVLRSVVAPAESARAAWEAVRTRGQSFVLGGSHWDLMAGEGDHVVSDIMAEDGVLAKLMGDARIVLFPWPTHATAHLVLSALAHGAFVVVRGRPGAIGVEFPELTAIEEGVWFYEATGQLADHLHQLACPNETFERRRARAQQGVLAEHTMAHRLRAMVASLSGETAREESRVVARGA